MQRTLQRAGVALRQLLPSARTYGDQEVYVTSCCSDSRCCQPGDLFVAITGNNVDGHDYIQEAVEAGATAILSERLIVCEVPVVMVDNTRQAYGELCQKLAGLPCTQMRTFGIAGSAGKTTTAMLLASILDEAGRSNGFVTSMGFSDGVEPALNEKNDPSPAAQATWLARMAANGCTDALVETSAIGLAQHTHAGEQFDAAILTNIKPQDLEHHNSVQNYHDAQARIFKLLKPHGYAVINADDPGSAAMLETLENPTITIGIHQEAEVTATLLERHPNEQTFLLHAGNETSPVRTEMIGDHHIYNCLTAAATGLVAGIDLPTVVRGIEKTGSLPGRMERLDCGQDFNVFVDQAGTPNTMIASLKAIRQVTKGRTICVFGAEGDTDPSQRPLLGRIAEKSSDLAVITSDNPGTEAPLQIAHDILDGFSDPSKAHILPNRAEAIRMALQSAEPGDSVIIAGKGHENVQRTANGAVPHDDRKVAREWLYNSVREETSAEAPGLHCSDEAFPLRIFRGE